MSLDQADLIGKIVLSSSFGAGKIVEITKMSGDRHFLVIESIGNNVKNFVPMEDNLTYRYISSKDDLESLLGKLSKKVSSEEFDSKKDRVNYFKQEAKVQDLESVAQLLKELHGLEDRNTAEEQIFNKLIDSLALEYSLVMGQNVDSAREVVVSSLI